MSIVKSVNIDREKILNSLLIAGMVGSMAYSNIRFSSQRGEDPTPTPTSEMTPDPEVEVIDQQNLEKVLDASLGDTLNLEFAKTAYIIQPNILFFPDPRFAALTVGEGDNQQVYAYVTNIGCLHDSLVDAPDSKAQRYTIKRRFARDDKVWIFPPDTRIDTLEAQVWVESIEGAPAILVLEDASYQGVELECKPPLTDQLGEAIANIDAGEIGERLGDIIGDFTQGIKQGLRPDR